MTLILVAGAIASGKSTVATALATTLDGGVVRVRDALAEVLGVDNTDRVALQELGAELDRRTNGRWLVEYLEHRLESSSVLIVDSMRTRRQTVPILERARSAFLIYLDARPETRLHRFDLAKQADAVKRSLSFTEAMRHPTEIGVSELRPLADLVLETDDLDVETVVAEIVAAMRS